MALPPSAKKPYENGQPAKLLHGCETTVGWISRKNLALRSRRSFFLTSLFIELIEEFGERTSAFRTTSRLHFPYDLPQNAEPELDVAGGEV
jgi:hypothetical protein